MAAEAMEVGLVGGAFLPPARTSYEVSVFWSDPEFVNDKNESEYLKKWDEHNSGTFDSLLWNPYVG